MFFPLAPETVTYLITIASEQRASNLVLILKKETMTKFQVIVKSSVSSGNKILIWSGFATFRAPEKSSVLLTSSVPTHPHSLLPQLGQFFLLEFTLLTFLRTAVLP